MKTTFLILMMIIPMMVTPAFAQSDAIPSGISGLLAGFLTPSETDSLQNGTIPSEIGELIRGFLAPTGADPIKNEMVINKIDSEFETILAQMDSQHGAVNQNIRDLSLKLDTIAKESHERDIEMMNNVIVMVFLGTLGGVAIGVPATWMLTKKFRHADKD